jgi:pantoate--beta-alanine ligase
MEVITEPHAMQAWADMERAAGRRISLVPTMGALHAGHLALVDEAKRRGDRVVVSIFINPLQFNRRDDFDRYPRDLEQDDDCCRAAGVAVIYAPGPGAMYPEGFLTGVDVEGLTEPLCGRDRPGHFRGVMTVVAKLFNAVRPHAAVFGEKDYQQLAVIRRMTTDLDFGVEIVGVPTVREADGVALSSRNQRLSSPERAAARCLPRALEAAAKRVEAGETAGGRIVDAAAAVIDQEPLARLEYAECRDPNSLEDVVVVDRPTLLALCVWVGGVRLIDNRVLAPGRNS